MRGRRPRFGVALACCALLCAAQGPAPRRSASTQPAAPGARTQPATSGRAPVRLRLGPQAGTYLWTRRHQTVQTIVPVGQGPAKARKNWQSLTISGDLEIGAADAKGRRTLSLRCAQVDQTLVLGEDVRKYDSAGPKDKQDAELRRQWRPLIGWRGTKATGEDGRVLKLTGVERLLSRVEPGPRLAEMRQRLRQLAEEMLEEQGIGWWGPLVPDEAVAPGQAWRATVFLPAEGGLGKVKMDCGCRLRNVVAEDGRKIAAIDFTASTRVDARAVDSRLLVLLPVKAQMRETDLSLTGRLRFALDTGLPVGLTTQVKGKGRLVVGDAKGTTAALDVSFRSDREEMVHLVP